jgi:transposase
MIVGVVLDGEGWPISCELWPGNTADVTTLLPVVDRLRQRFHIGRACIVADRGMICQETLNELDETGRPYILGARMRKQQEVREQVLAEGGRFRVVHEAPQKSTDPAPLKVKEVTVQGHRYVVCVNPEQVEADRAKRAQIVAALRDQLRRGDKSLVGNKGYRQYLKVEGQGHFVIDEAKLVAEARYDGTWVLRTNYTDHLSAAEIALQYKKLWLVEHWFRDCKSLLETRPIYHRRDETIRGHVFCSFLALVLRQELQARLAQRGHVFEWADVMRDLERVQYVHVAQGGKSYILRSELQGTAGKVFQSAGVAVPPTVQEVE